MAGRATVPAIRARKVRNGSEPLVMLTAYDAPSARIVDAGGADLILVGDSLAMVVLGYEDTSPTWSITRRRSPGRNRKR